MDGRITLECILDHHVHIIAIHWTALWITLEITSQ